VNVSLLRPSGEFITRFEIATPDQLAEKLQELLASGKRIPLRSRVEAGGQSWLITSFSPVQLREDTQQPVGNAAAAPVIETAWRRQSNRGAACSQMMSGLAWCVGGAVITVVSYTAAASGPGGGSYVVAWGAILFGGIRFLKGFAGLRNR
jgi:hypothetical protein